MDYEDKYERLNSKLVSINAQINEILVENFLIIQSSSEQITSQEQQVQTLNAQMNELTNKIKVA